MGTLVSPVCADEHKNSSGKCDFDDISVAIVDILWPIPQRCNYPHKDRGLCSSALITMQIYSFFIADNYVGDAALTVMIPSVVVTGMIHYSGIGQPERA